MLSAISARHSAAPERPEAPMIVDGRQTSHARCARQPLPRCAMMIICRGSVGEVPSGKRREGDG